MSEMTKTIKEYARCHKLILDLKEVVAIEFRKKPLVEDVKSPLDYVVTFHMKSGKLFKRRITSKHITRITNRYKQLNKKPFDCMKLLEEE